MADASAHGETRVRGLFSEVFKADIAARAFTKTVELAGAGIRKAFDLGRFAVDSAAEFEQNRIAFEVMLGSAERAKALLKQVSDFAARTPFELPEVVTASKQLLAMGASADNVLEDLKMIGDLAAGTSAPLDRLILNFGQVRLQGKLTGRELRDFAVNGVPLLTQLSKSLGVSEAAVFDMVEAGEVGFDKVRAAFQAMTGEGGKFQNIMARQATSFNGVMSNVRDNFGRLARDVIGISDSGEIREGSIFARLTRAATLFLQWTNENRAQITSFLMGIVDGLAGIWRVAKGAFAYLMENKDTIIFVFNVIATAARVAFGVIASAAAVAMRVLGGIKAAVDAISGAIGWVIDRWNDFKRTIERGISLPRIELPKISLPIPGFAEGGVMPRTGLARVGERGPELVALPAGARVFSNRESRELTRGSGITIGEVHVHNEVDFMSVLKFAGVKLRYSGL